MMSWTNYQNAEFLEKTRIGMMNRDMLPLIAERLHLRSGLKILDVGCGTGEYTFFLGEAVQNATFTGIDLEAQFIAKARQRASGESANRYIFVQGDALSLPFADESFDLVVSQTFLTTVPDYEKALAEMYRVCCTDGLIASTTPVEIWNAHYEKGRWPFYFGWKRRYDELSAKLWELYEACAPLSGAFSGVPLMKVPEVFVQAGLRDVSAYPVASLFSLSDSSIPDETKRRYIELDYLSEVHKMQDYLENVPEFAQRFSISERSEYEQLCGLKRDTLLAAIGENHIWEWLYYPMVLVTGRKELQKWNGIGI